MKKLCAFRLTKKAIDNIEKVQALTGKPKVRIVENGIELYLAVEISNKNRLYNNSNNSYTLKNEKEGLNGEKN